MNIINANGDIDIGRGQLGTVIYDSPTTNINLNSTYSQFYNKYILTPTGNITCTLPIIGNASNNVAPGFEIYIINTSIFTISIPIITFTLRSNSVVLLTAKSVGVWQVVTKYESNNFINSGSGAPVALATDIIGDIYIENTGGTLYIYDGATWQSISSPSFNSLSINNSVGGYKSKADVVYITSSEANLRDKAVYIDSSGFVKSAVGISSVSYLGSTTDDYINTPDITNGLLNGNSYDTYSTIKYNPLLGVSIDAFSVTNTTPATIGRNESGYVYTNNGQRCAILLAKDLNGYVKWFIKLATTSSTPPYFGNFWYNMTLQEIFVPFQYTGNATLYDFSNPYVPILVYPNTIGATDSNCGIIRINYNTGIYTGNTSQPIVITSGSGGNCSVGSITTDTNSNLLFGCGLKANITYVFNGSIGGSGYSVTPPGTGTSTYTGMCYCKYNLVTNVFDWTATFGNTPNGTFSYGITKVTYTPNNEFIVSNLFTNVSGSPMQMSRITYRTGSTTPENITLPDTTATTSGIYSTIVFKIDITIGKPIWINTLLNNSLTEGVGVVAPSSPYYSSIDYNNNIVVTQPYYNSLSLVTDLKAINITATTSGTAISSSGLFSSNMDGQIITGPGIVDGTIFTYSTASSGFLSAAASTNYTNANFRISNYLPISSSSVTINVTINTYIITSAGLFTPEMSGMYFVQNTYLYPGTYFTYINNSNGYISLPAISTAAGISATVTTTMLNLTNTNLCTISSIKIGINSNYLYYTNLISSTNSTSINMQIINSAIDRFNNIYRNVRNLSGGNITIGSSILPDTQYGLIKIDDSGNVIYGTVLGNFYLQMADANANGIIVSRILSISNITFDGLPFNLITRGIGRLFTIENDERSIGIAATNLPAGSSVPVVLSGEYTTSTALSPGLKYYINPSTGLISNSNTFGLIPIGQAFAANTLFIY